MNTDDPPEDLFWEDGTNSVYSTDSAEDSERERVPRTSLGRLARRRFEAMLRALTGQRGDIARSMCFSLEHAECASEVADIIVSSILITTTPVPRKVARLHLICDILHNSAASVSNAWTYRQEFQSRMGMVFDHLSTIYHSFPGRITAETFKTQITSVVDVWEDSIVFPPDFTTDLRRRLDGATTEATEESAVEATPREAKPDDNFAARFKPSSFKPATVPANSDGESMDMDEDDVVEQRYDEIDGEPMDDLDGEPLADVDGEPIDDIDGEPL